MQTLLNKEKSYLSKTFCNLSESDEEFSNIEFEDCEFQDCDFSESVFKQCKFIDCLFSRCNLSVIKVPLSHFTNVSFDECKLIGVDWTRAKWPGFFYSVALKFNKCIINDSSFIGLTLDEIVLEECKAHDVDFRDGSFREAVFCHTDFTNSLFGKTDLTEADFSEALNYDIDIFNNNISRAKFTHTEAIRLLNCLDIELVD